MTVEAAVVLPLFAFLVVAFLTPMKALDTQRKIQTATEMVCEDLSLYTYLGETGTYIALCSDVAACAWLQKEVGKYSETVVVNRASVPDENGDVVLEVVYQEQAPFFSGLWNGIVLQVSAKRRGWNGLEGKLKANGIGADGGDHDIEMVYVGKGMGRYHKDRGCHYISNEYQAVSVDEAKNMRDADGHRFTACSSCGGSIGKNGTVYITPGGQHYHGNTECRAMVSYVRKVPLADVIHLGACSYCGGR